MLSGRLVVILAEMSVDSLPNFNISWGLDRAFYESMFYDFITKCLYQYIMVDVVCKKYPHIFLMREGEKERKGEG